MLKKCAIITDSGKTIDVWAEQKSYAVDIFWRMGYNVTCRHVFIPGLSEKRKAEYAARKAKKEKPPGCTDLNG